jgi:transcriptional regulator with XRE-family HTH domain
MIGLNQTEMADLCGCSPQTIQSVELLRMPLSGKVATKISEATGINLEWLMAGDCAAPPQKAEFFPTPVYFDSWNDDEADSTYSIDSFAKYRSFVEASVLLRPPDERPECELTMGKAAQRRLELLDLQDKLLLRFCAQVLKDTQKHQRASLMRWQLKKFLLDQCKRYEVSIQVISPQIILDKTSERHPPPNPAKRLTKRHRD